MSEELRAALAKCIQQFQVIERALDEGGDIYTEAAIGINAARAALATPDRADLAPTRENVEWLVWYARKQKGTVAEVAQRALDENPGLRPGGWATPDRADLDVERLADWLERAQVPWVKAPRSEYVRIADRILAGRDALARASTPETPDD